MKMMKKQARRRRRMHPTRRRQENIGIFAGVLSVMLLLTGGLVAIIIACVTIPVAIVSAIASQTTPPPTYKAEKPRRTKVDKRIPTGTLRVRPWQSIGAATGRKPCGARCQYSTKPKNTCRCSCLGRSHGSKR